jgi:polar amino acid transport system substrate-binding protein
MAMHELRNGTRILALGLASVIVTMAMPAAVAESALDRIKSEKVMRVGVANEPPYGYQAADGRITGEAPEIARRILAEIDTDSRVEGVVTQFDRLIDDLQSGKIDVIAAGMYITPARCEQVAFTNPTYKVGEAFVVKAGNPKSLTDFATVARQSDARLAVMAGAVEYGYAYEADVYIDQVSVFPDYAAAIVALEEGQVDAIAMTALTAQTLVENTKSENIESTSQFFPEIDGKSVAGYGAFAFRTEDTDLVAAFNQQLATFIGSEAHLEIVNDFGFLPANLPDTTAEALCGG